MSEVIYDTQQIMEIIPHRYPFLLIDKIVEFEDNVRVVGVKNVTINEAFFQGHFPGKPVMPGVLVIEALAQTGAILAIKSKDGVYHGNKVYLVGASDFKWKRQVVPGDTLTLEMVSLRKRRPLWIMRGEASVNGVLVASGEISAAEAP